MCGSVSEWDLHESCPLELDSGNNLPQDAFSTHFCRKEFPERVYSHNLAGASFTRARFLPHFCVSVISG